MAPGGLRGVKEPAQINVQRCAVPECRHRDDLVLLLGAPRFSRRPVGLVSHAEGTRQIRLFVLSNVLRLGHLRLHPLSQWKLI